MSGIRECPQEPKGDRIIRRLNEAILGMTKTTDLSLLLCDAKEEIRRLQDGATLAGLLDQAEDVWTDYGSGFRIHFSFPPSHRSDVILRIHRRRASSGWNRADATPKSHPATGEKEGRS